MSEESKEPEDEILKLIRLIDQNRSTTFKPLDAFYGLNTFIISLVYVFVVVWFFTTFSSESVGVKLSVALAFLAVVVGIFTLLAPFMEENVVDRNFSRLGKCVGKDEKPLLKALVKIKAKHREFDLEPIYNMNKDMFTKEKLLERLYE